MLTIFGSHKSDKSNTNSEQSFDSMSSLQIFIAHEIMSFDWIYSKVSGHTPTACIHLSNGKITYYTKDNDPVTLDSTALEGLFSRIGKGWSRLAKPAEQDYIMKVIESHYSSSMKHDEDSLQRTRACSF